MIEYRIVDKKNFIELEGSKLFSSIFGFDRDINQQKADSYILFYEDSKWIGFCGFYLLNDKWCYLASGGMLPECRGFKTLNILKTILNSLPYDIIQTEVKNDNLPMLKIALQSGFRIVGAMGFNSDIFVNLILKK